MKKIILILFGFGLFFSWQGVVAQELPEYYLNLSQTTTTKGYTASTPEAKIKIGVVPYAFSQETQLKIVNLGREAYPAPEGYKIVSDIYLYDFSNTPQKLLTISMNYDSFSGSLRELYFWEKGKQQWRSLPTNELGNQTAAGLSPFKSARIAILEKKINNEAELLDVITAKSAIVMDAKTGEVVFEKASQVKRPIASLTKIMTALVFLDHNPGWDSEIEFLEKDDTIPSKIYIVPGDTLKITDLFYSMLVKSANNAAATLARATNLYPESYFIWLMNLKAQELGLANTIFADPTGLDEKNVSTAYDYALLSKYALKIADIPRATTTQYYSFKTIKNDQTVDLVNTSKLFNSDLEITLTKTGFTYEAGNCLMTAAKDFKTGQEYIAVVLNSQNGHLSSDVYTLLDYYLKN